MNFRRAQDPPSLRLVLGRGGRPVERGRGAMVVAKPCARCAAMTVLVRTSPAGTTKCFDIEPFSPRQLPDGAGYEFQWAGTGILAVYHAKWRPHGWDYVLHQTLCPGAQSTGHGLSQPQQWRLEERRAMLAQAERERRELTVVAVPSVKTTG